MPSNNGLCLRDDAAMCRNPVCTRGNTVTRSGGIGWWVGGCAYPAHIAALVRAPFAGRKGLWLDSRLRGNDGDGGGNDVDGGGNDDGSPAPGAPAPSPWASPIEGEGIGFLPTQE